MSKYSNRGNHSMSVMHKLLWKPTCLKRSKKIHGHVMVWYVWFESIRLAYWPLWRKPAACDFSTDSQGYQSWRDAINHALSGVVGPMQNRTRSCSGNGEPNAWASNGISIGVMWQHDVICRLTNKIVPQPFLMVLRPNPTSNSFGIPGWGYDTLRILGTRQHWEQIRQLKARNCLSGFVARATRTTIIKPWSFH